jgi:peptidoglycan/LPS O-acetylase OafA/YrhL
MKKELEYLLAPDLLKGVAIIWIVLFHIFKDFNHIFCGGDNYATDFACRIIMHGALGVDLFVIISGYLLAFSCMGKDHIEWMEFLKKRLFRIFPLYWIAIISILFLEYLIGNNGDNYQTQSILLHLFGIHGLTSFIFDLQGAWWFITLIVQLYLFFPMLWYVYQKIPLYLVLTSAILLTASARFIPFANIDSNYSIFAFIVDFCLGIALAREISPKLQFRLTLKGTFYSVVANGFFIAAIYYDTIELFSYAFGLFRPFVSFGIFLAIGFVCSQVIAKIKWVSFPLSKYGKYSYAIYLFHRPLIYKWVVITSTMFFSDMVWFIFLLIMLPMGKAIETCEARLFKTFRACIRK